MSASARLLMVLVKTLENFSLFIPGRINTCPSGNSSMLTLYWFSIMPYAWNNKPRVPRS